jgi:predicted TIM-barrel fold metal-dependent hydrolase
VVVRPPIEYWSIEPWVSDALFAALAEQRIPVLCLEKFIPPVQAAELTQRYPGLPLVLAELGYRDLRVLLAALQAFPDLYVSVGNAFTGHALLAHFVRHAGAGRLLFGTGFPAAEPFCAIAQLTYAGIGDEERRLIGAGNLERLVRDIAR